MRSPQEYEDDSAARAERERAARRDLERGRVDRCAGLNDEPCIGPACLHPWHVGGVNDRSAIPELGEADSGVPEWCEGNGCTHDPCLTGLDAPAGAGDAVEAFRG